jgi:hypothetical protein
MQLYAEDIVIEAAIKELEAALPLVALQNIIEHRVAAHKPRVGLRRRLELLRSEQLKREMVA